MMLPLKMQMQMEMQLLRNRSIILTMKIPMIMKMEKKFMVVKMHPKMTLPLKKTHRMLFRENSEIHRGDKQTLYTQHGSRNRNYKKYCLVRKFNVYVE